MVKNNIDALRSVYLSLGGSLDDTYEDINGGSPVSAYRSVKDHIAAISKLGGGSGLPEPLANDVGKSIFVNSDLQWQLTDTKQNIVKVGEGILDHTKSQQQIEVPEWVDASNSSLLFYADNTLIGVTRNGSHCPGENSKIFFPSTALVDSKWILRFTLGTQAFDEDKICSVYAALNSNEYNQIRFHPHVISLDDAQTLITTGTLTDTENWLPVLEITGELQSGIIPYISVSIGSSVSSSYILPLISSINGTTPFVFELLAYVDSLGTALLTCNISYDDANASDVIQWVVNALS